MLCFANRRDSPNAIYKMFDLYRPLKNYVDQLMQVKQSDIDAAHDIDMIIPHELTVLFNHFCRSQREQTLAANFGLFTEHLAALDSIEFDENDDAPSLHGWSLAQHPTSLCSALGYTVEHPRLRYGSPVVTSVVCRIACDHKWIRTWNRFYTLEEYDASTFEVFKARGLLNSDVTLMPISSHRRA